MSKINKLGKSSIVIAILSFLLVAVLAFGGTYAYFSAKTEDVDGAFKTGYLEITTFDGSAITALTTDTKVAPGQMVLGTAQTPAEVTAVIKGNIKYYIRAYFEVNVNPEDEDASHTGNATPANCGDNVEDAHEEILDIKVTDWKEEGTSKYFYPTAFAAKQATDAGVSEKVQLTIALEEWVGSNGCTYYMNADVTLSLRLEVLQAEYIDAAIAKVDGVTSISTAADLHKVWDVAVAFAQSDDTAA